MTWWRDAVIYQIYPRSFCDSDGDGIGDLNGIRSQLEYLSWLGVDALWLTPIYPSPMKDFGYDVSNYVAIDSLFGSMQDFDRLVGEAHERGIRVILDWVPNHTSSEHPWFINSRSARDSALRDWYVWRDAKADGSLPNNWIHAWSEESVWTWDEATEQYYLHCFLPSQPDLNWANDRVREAMEATMRFWLDRGVDGLRMDVVHLLGKDLDVDDPDELRMLGHTPFGDTAVTHDYLREIRRVLDEYEGDRMSIGEVYLFDPERVATYYGDHDELHLAFNFASLFTQWRAEEWRGLIERTERALESVDGWPTWVLSNHDNARIATRLAGDPRRVRAAILLLLTLRGTPFLYQGEELGLADAVIPADRVVDPGGRDGCRAPIPWTREADFGWRRAPWLPFVENAAALSVDAQRTSDDSVLALTREILALRRRMKSLQSGGVENLMVEGNVLFFDRVAEGERLRVMVNFSRDAPCALPAGTSVLLSSGDSPAGGLGPGEAVILDVN